MRGATLIYILMEDFDILHVNVIAVNTGINKGLMS